jgi:PIN domain nuclease of toxin-antitoxin system
LTRLLLDTHVVLWWRDDDHRLKQSTRDAIKAASYVAVSMASAWETAIKASLGKLRLPTRFEVGLEENGFQSLPITFDHIDRIATLPRHHGDPFDRMLVAQAQAEGLTLVTGDRAFQRYGLHILWT